MANWLAGTRSPTACMRMRWTSWRGHNPGARQSSCPTATPRFQPRKVERSGLWNAFADHVLIFVRKEQ